MRWLFATIVVAGCASARVEGGNNDIDANQNNDADANNNQDDAFVPPVDMPPPPPDAPPQPVSVTLQQTGNTTIAAANSIACGVTQGDGTSDTRENSWYRVFSLAEHGVTNTLSINKVTIGIQESSGAAAQVKVGLYTGAFGAAQLDLTKVSPLNSATISVPASPTGGAGVSVPVPITANVPANSLIIVEVLSPDLGANDGLSKFTYLGATTSAETHPGYIRAPICGINNPVTPQSVNATQFANTHLIITVTGTHLP